MEATTGRPRARLIVIDFLSTLFATFCIGAATALVLGACVMLMAGDAHGAQQPRPATTADLVLAHYTAARHLGLALAERTAPRPKPAKGKAAAPSAN